MIRIPNSRVGRGELAIVVRMGLLGPVDVHHRRLNESVPELVADGEQVCSTVDHVARQAVAHQVRPDASGRPT